jgi:hypothetical protein
MPLSDTVYKPINDRGLTIAQSKLGGFKPDLYKDGKPGEFRFPSNPTLNHHSTGYHEAAVTTDTFNYLRSAKSNMDGTHTLSDKVNKGSYLKQFAKKKVDSQLFKWILKHADGFRTDTAQTILSGKNGTVAGHAGSGIARKGEPSAHDLLRKVVMDILQLKPSNNNGLTEKSVAIIFGSVTVSSMAPGKLARKVTGKTKSLKAGQLAKKDWEVLRNKAKARVETLFNKLDAKEKEFVRKHAVNYLDSTQIGVPANSRRVIPTLRATSQERDDAEVLVDEVAGGDYKNGGQTLQVDKQPPEVEFLGLYVSESLRARRR